MAIKRNSEALKGIVEALFAMLGLDGEATVSRIPQPLHRAVLRVLRPAEIRRAAPYRHRGPRPCGEAEACCLASDAGGAHREGRRKQASLLPALRYAEKLQSATPRKGQAAFPRIHVFGRYRLVTLWQRVLASPIPFPRPMAS